MVPVVYFSQISSFYLIAFFTVIIIVCYEAWNRRKFLTKKNAENLDFQEPPSPMKLPIIGHLHLLGGYEVPYQAFTELGKKYGKLVKLQLGAVKCVVVNGQKNIREALVTKGHHFDSRPNFERYQMLFSGNKENSLAFCDWSETQKMRRDMLRSHTFPRAFTNNFNTLETLISQGVDGMINQISTDKVVDLKPVILRQCANIFTNHFCTKNYDISDVKFIKMVENFDEIFYEVNQGYAADFLPFLLPLHKKNLEHITGLTHEIRNFVVEEIIGDRYENFDIEDEPVDYVECLIKSVKGEENDDFCWDTALFALEDIIGGHSAVANFLMKLLGFLVKEPQVQKKIQEEIQQVIDGKNCKNITIGDRTHMPYTEATIFEAIRLIASPIVPRVANQTSSIEGYRIEKDTVLFLNNYDLSMSEDLWEQPQKFMPERFIKGNRLVKPEYFLPFGGGRRSCMGYKMVQLISFGLLGGLMQNFTMVPSENENYKVPIGSLALPKNTYKFRFEKR